MKENVGVFTLRKTDLRLFRGLEPAFRSLLKIPDLTPEDIVGLARAIRSVQRLPQSTPNADVSVSIDYNSNDYSASWKIRISCDELNAEHSLASRFNEQEFEYFRPFTMTIGVDGSYDKEGEKEDFFTSFISLAEDGREGEGYTITVLNESTPEALQPCDDEQLQ
jgi:hypothetical protein